MNKKNLIQNADIEERNKLKSQYDHIPSKVKQYRLEMRRQSTSTNKESLETDNDLSEIISEKTLPELLEELKQEIKNRDSIIEEKDDQIAEISIKHSIEIALLKMSLDSFRYELSRFKDTVDINKNSNKSGNGNMNTPLHTFGNMLKTPIRSISNAFLRTPSNKRSPASGVKNDKNKSLTFIFDNSENDICPFEESPTVLIKVDSKSNLSTCQSSNLENKANFSSSKKGPRVKKQKSTSPSQKCEEHNRSTFTKLIDFSQNLPSKAWKKSISSIFKKNKAPENSPVPIIITSPSTDGVRRRVSFSSTYTECSQMRFTVETPPKYSNSQKKDKSHKMKKNNNSNKKNKINCFRPIHENDKKDSAKSEERLVNGEKLIVHRLDDIITKLEEIKDILI